MLKAALLFYRRLQSTLKDMGFEVNPYNPCFANMMVNGEQIAVCHRKEAIVSEFAMALAKEFEPKTTISRGKVHSYLGMDLDFGTCPGTMIISMINRGPVKVVYIRPSYFKRFFLTVSTYVWYSGRK